MFFRNLNLFIMSFNKKMQYYKFLVILDTEDFRYRKRILFLEILNKIDNDDTTNLQYAKFCKCNSSLYRAR